jgi:hypothetical protein
MNAFIIGAIYTIHCEKYVGRLNADPSQAVNFYRTFHASTGGRALRLASSPSTRSLSNPNAVKPRI